MFTTLIVQGRLDFKNIPLEDVYHVMDGLSLRPFTPNRKAETADHSEGSVGFFSKPRITVPEEWLNSLEPISDHIVYGAVAFVGENEAEDQVIYDFDPLTKEWKLREYFDFDYNKSWERAETLIYPMLENFKKNHPAWEIAIEAAGYQIREFLYFKTADLPVLLDAAKEYETIDPEASAWMKEHIKNAPHTDFGDEDE